MGLQATRAIARRMVVASAASTRAALRLHKAARSTAGRTANAASTRAASSPH
jgi:hypothetical protein